MDGLQERNPTGHTRGNVFQTCNAGRAGAQPYRSRARKRFCRRATPVAWGRLSERVPFHGIAYPKGLNQSVEGGIGDFGLQENSTPVALNARPSKSRLSVPDAKSPLSRAIRPVLSDRFANC